MVQVVLKRQSSEGMLTLVTLLPNSPKICVGAVISLDNQDTKWTVDELYTNIACPSTDYERDGCYVDCW